LSACVIGVSALVWANDAVAAVANTPAMSAAHSFFVFVLIGTSL
jgi:hypothetical protein